jgi:hypothetical protein
MSIGQSVAYRIRPNKALDRELFLSFLVWLSPRLSLKEYQYLGLGGPFLEDFRLVHSRTGIRKMTCIECEYQIHKRQMFNRPLSSIKCINSRLEDYLDETELKTPVIIWFDYTNPNDLKSQIERFAYTAGSVKVGSILRITLNANPSSLGNQNSCDNNNDNAVDRSPLRTLQEYRLLTLKERLGDLFPSGLSVEGMVMKTYGLTLLKVLEIAVDKQMLSYRDRSVAWAFTTHYADGQAMVTATLVVLDNGNKDIEKLIKNWEYYTPINCPHKLNLPDLSTFERLTMESRINRNNLLKYELPLTDLGDDPIKTFKKFYRIYPHFSRIEL